MRLLIVIAFLLVAMIASFAIWGSDLESRLAGEAALEWYRSHGVLGGAAIAALLVADVVLPIPTTPLLTLLGSLYGPFVGGALGATGSLLSGLAAYGIARTAPRGVTERLLGGRDLRRLDDHFRGRNWRRGGWSVALSRWLPMLPEVVALLAGLARMPFSLFLLALVSGTLPMALAFAALGAGLSTRPILATVLAALLPALLWPVVRRLAPAASPLPSPAPVSSTTLPPSPSTAAATPSASRLVTLPAVSGDPKATTGMVPSEPESPDLDAPSAPTPHRPRP